MKLFKKLDARGFAHHLVLVAVVLVVAVGGTYYLVASHADACNPVSGASDPVSDAVSDPASAPNCAPATSPVTAPVSDPTVGVVSCVITGVPVNPSNGQVLKPMAAILNSTDTAVAPSVVETLNLAGKQGGSKTVNLPSIAPGATYDLSLYTATIGFSDGTAEDSTGNYAVVSTSPAFNCEASFNLPGQVLTFAASCTISNVPATVKKGASFSPKVTVKDVGSGAFTVVMSANVNPNKGSTVNFKGFALANFGPGSNVTRTLGKYTLPKSSTATKGVVSAKDSNAKTAFSCSKSFKI